MDTEKVTALTVLNLSAAFDTIDYPVLLDPPLIGVWHIGDNSHLDPSILNK